MEGECSKVTINFLMQHQANEALKIRCIPGMSTTMDSA